MDHRAWPPGAEADCVFCQRDKLRDALRDAYGYISDPKHIDNEIAVYDVRDYNKLTTKIRAALMGSHEDKR